jgi:ABC-type dipeptide/oligopeptide/nickel transport system permease subunit
VRLARGDVLSVRENAYVEAARALAAGRSHEISSTHRRAMICPSVSESF